MKTKFLYHADAVGATGSLTLPFHETMEVQASVALPVNGGHASTHVEDFRHRKVFSFRRAESQVVGSYSVKDKAHGTASQVMLEGVNILDVVTCDRIVMRLTSKHDDVPHAEPSFMLHGTRFENLRIGGQKIDVDLATDLFNDLSTWDKLTTAFKNDKKAKAELDKLAFYPDEGKKLAAAKGTFGCTLARSMEKLPAGLTYKDGGIYVPHFGTVRLAEFYVCRKYRRLLMLHVDLGCSTEGCFSGGSGGGGGDPFP
jgi:hypothetical protein